jgi:hypothetical protein
MHPHFFPPEIQHGLSNDGIPQVNIDQLNPKTSFLDLLYQTSQLNDKQAQHSPT